jgi:hypothetical protein
LPARSDEAGVAEAVESLAIAALQERCRARDEVTLARHYRVIRLLAQGRSRGDVARLTSFAVRRVEQLLALERLRVRRALATGGAATARHLWR